MKKHITAGPTGLNRIRSLVAFRHHNPIARFVSTLLAFAIAMLLVIGPSAAYGDDTAPTDPTATDTSAPADTTSPDTTSPDTTTDSTTDASTTPDPTTTPDAAVNPDSSTSSTETTVSEPTAPSSPMLTSLKSLALAAPALEGTTVVVPCTYNAPGAIAVPAGKFEIDGNLCLTGDPTTPAGAVGDADWDSLAYGDPTTGAYKIDELGDTSGFTQGSAETSDPRDWVGGHVPNDKNDIETAWGYSQAIGTDVYAYFGFTSSSAAGGTQEVTMEYNQNAPVDNTSDGPNGTGASTDLLVPDRTAGDLLFHFSMNGSAPLSFSTVYVWTLVNLPNNAPNPDWKAGCVSVAGSGAAGGWCPVTGIAPGTFHSAVSSNGQFAEGSINISALPIFTGKCSGEFGTMQMRTTTGGTFNSSLKDYVGPLTVTTPSNCGKILINKVDENGNRLPGATFTVSPNPDPTQANNVAYSITDNDAKDQDARPGYIEINPVDPTTPDNVYTVTETGAPTPAGTYMIDNPHGTSPNPQTVGLSGTATFDFVDHRIWKGLTAVKTATPSYTATYHWSVNKEISADGTTGWTTDTTSADPLIKKVADGTTNADRLYYRVSATAVDPIVKTDYKVSGTITVSNPSDNVGSMNAVVTDSLPGATCLVDNAASKSISVNKGSSVDVDYVCTFAGTPTADQMDDTNTAHVTWDRSTYPQVVGDLTDVGGMTRKVEPTATYNFANATVTPIDKSVTLTDNRVDNQAPFTSSWTLDWDDAHAMADHKAVSPVYYNTVTGAGPHTCSAVLSNTVTETANGAPGVTDDSHVVGTDSAYGKVCEGSDLTISRMDARGFTRTFPWSIEKSTSTPSITTTGDTATAHYGVTVTAGDGADSGWSMTGHITVQNPNDWESVSVTSLPVSYTDAGVTCTAVGPFPYSLTANDDAAGGTDQHTFDYSCSFGTPPAQPDYSGTITATVNWSDAFTPGDHVTNTHVITEADWDKTLANDTVTVYDDNATPDDGNPANGDETADDRHWDLDWSDVYNNNAQHSITLDSTSDPSTDIVFDAPAAGGCQTHVNTVKVLGDGNVVLDADGNAANNSATVEVCKPAPALITKDTPTGTFERTYKWDLEKFVKNSAGNWVDFASFPSNDYTHSFDYQVRAIPLPVDPATDDSNWVMSGKITLTNQNTDSSIDDVSGKIVEVPSVGAVTSTCLGTRTDPALQLGLPVYNLTLPYSVTMKSGDDPLELWYQCTFSGKPTYDASNVVKFVDANDNVLAQSASKPFTFGIADNGEHDKTLPVFDNEVDQSPAVNLGDATWFDTETNPADADDFIVKSYGKTLEADHDTVGCTDPDFVNTAWIGGTATEQSAVKDTATAEICINAPHWTAEKVNIHGDGPVPTDSDVTYRLTAHKVSGVDPTNIELFDDLSDLESYVDLDAFVPPTAPAGTHVDWNSTTRVLTWSIDVLGATDRTLDFTVHVLPDAYGADLPNLVTAPKSDNCVDDDITTANDECKTDNDTPHYTLEKTSNRDGQTVMPPYLGADGTVITYTLTVRNDSDAPINGTTMPGEQVTDNLTDVLDNATWLGNLTPTGQAVRDGNTLTWTLPAIPVGGTATLTYQVQVNGDQWDQALTNVATEGPGGDCVPAEALILAAAVVNPNCTTTSRTPGYAQIQVLKVDADTGAPLAGADFTLSHGETVLETGTSNDQGLVSFTTKLQPGTFTVTETKAPADYLMPADPSQDVVITADDLDYPAEAAAPVRVTFNDPPTGTFTIAKAHQEQVGGSWVAGDGQVAFGDAIKYVMTVTATGPKVFQDATVTDYVPGWNPADHTTAPAGTKGELDAGSITCSGAITCTTSYDAATGLITWHLTGAGDDTGDVQGDVGTVEFVVRMPNLPATSPLAGPGVSFAAVLWNQAYLDWRQADDVEESHHLSSNEVTDAANATLPPRVIPPIVSPPKARPPAVLPNTGGPDSWLLGAGLILLLGGGTLIAADRRRRHRS